MPNRIYAKLVSPAYVDKNPPKSAIIYGKFVCGTLPESYLNSIGFYRLEEDVMPSSDPPEGCHWETRYAYDDESSPTEIVQSWIAVDNPPPAPRTFSKIKMKLALAQSGLLDQFNEMLSTVELAPGYMADEAFRDAVTLDEDHPKFKDAVRLAKSEFGMTDEDVDRILAASVAE